MAKKKRQKNLCKKDSVLDACPVTCGLCCADSDTFKFKNKTCKWIAEVPKRIKLCKISRIKVECVKTCDNCQENPNSNSDMSEK